MKDVVLNNISKTYHKGMVQAVNDVTFHVSKGELFGLIGPDGAGKTSIFRILTTLLLPDGGTASVNGFDVVKDYKAIRKNVGYMPGKFSLYQDLSVQENLNFFAAIFHTSIEENYDLIKDIYIQLEPFRDRRAGKLSGGMKQKLALCCALIHRPTVLFLDEPTTGVDVVSRKEFWDMLKRLKQQGITILVSTPYMDEAMLCERIALIQNGQIMSIDTPENIIKQFPENLFAVKSDTMGNLLHDLKNIEIIKSCNAFGAYHHVTFNHDDPEMKEKLIRILEEKKHMNIELKPITPTIEDCFIKLMEN
ncbi:ABC transporter ATP-binding protein [Sphingobacterium chuzhouense]|uniref:ABC transporter ATP-binding protein n=1 Tax=Sphingobacterium chuzhouense TaxID=1742264 RepID=A0ABR7XPV1_9SPHI|nr:ABC transporter ATP-binding protein [Sphingobacterium chuzhouense]MBD1421173.1 ABC transporter ATP-binding protein [Sphingobacterium chuzhouense]